MSNEFYTILTDAGLAAIANASVSQSAVNFYKVAVGDGNGAYYTPTREMTALRRQTWIGPVASVQVDENNPNWINVEAVIPATDGGFYIREIGIFNEDNVLLAIGKIPETYKPSMESGSTKDLYLKAIFEVTNASVISLKVDPSVVMASKKYVDDKVAVVSGSLTSVRNAITQHLDDYVKHPAVATTTNTGNAYNVTLSPVPTTYANAMGLVLTINADSTGPATINVNGLGPIPIKNSQGVDVELKANAIYTFRYNGTTGNFILQGEGGGLTDAHRLSLVNDINTLALL